MVGLVVFEVADAFNTVSDSEDNHPSEEGRSEADKDNLNQGHGHFVLPCFFVAFYPNFVTRHIDCATIKGKKSQTILPSLPSHQGMSKACQT